MRTILFLLLFVSLSAYADNTATITLSIPIMAGKLQPLVWELEGLDIEVTFYSRDQYMIDVWGGFEYSGGTWAVPELERHGMKFDLDFKRRYNERYDYLKCNGDECEMDEQAAS